jgi:Flp pilus assembly protein TadG
MINKLSSLIHPQTDGNQDRRGNFLVLGLFSLIVAFGFTALTIDIGRIALTDTSMQNAADAAALAAAQEITVAVEKAGNDASNGVGDINSIAVSAAKTKAEEVVKLNGFYIDKEKDVAFGKRIYDKNTGKYSIQWGTPPYNSTDSYNVVKVTIRKDNKDSKADDAMLNIFFAPFCDTTTVALKVDAIAFVESRDIAIVLDYSASMNDDSSVKGMTSLGQSNVEANMATIWSDLGSPTYGSLKFTPEYPALVGGSGTSNSPKINVTWKGTSVSVTSTSSIKYVELRFTSGSSQTKTGSGKTGTFSGNSSQSGSEITKIYVRSGGNYSSNSSGQGLAFDFSNSGLMTAYGLTNNNYPVSGGSWSDYIDYATDDNTLSTWGYEYKLGGLSLLNYWFEYYPTYSSHKDLWKTHHYPFHAMKEGTTLFLNFLDGLDFGDHVGLVVFGQTSKIETKLVDAYQGVNVDLGEEWITDDYATINTIQTHKQASHYDGNTATGEGLANAKVLLDAKKRYGARPTVLLMSDGVANVYPNNWKLPNNWSWADLTDFDGDGAADYSSNTKAIQYAFYQAKQLVDDGCTIHTIGIGAGADLDFMQALAKAGGGQFIHVPGGTTVSQMEAEMLAAFAKIAANVPPPKLVNDN